MHEGWSIRDRGLAEALTEFEDRACRECGQPRHLAWDPETNGWWDVNQVVCEACAALDKAQKDQKTPESGSKPIVTLNADYER